MQECQLQEPDVSNSVCGAGAQVLAAHRADPCQTMVDHLLEQPGWKGTLRAEDVSALRAHEARLHDMPDAKRAHAVYNMAILLRLRARARHRGGAPP